MGCSLFLMALLCSEASFLKLHGPFGGTEVLGCILFDSITQWATTLPISGPFTNLMKIFSGIKVDVK